MNKKIFAVFLLSAAILLWIIIAKSGQFNCLSNLCGERYREKTNPSITIPGNTVPSKDGKCAKAGEEPVSNLDLTTGKTDPSIEVVPCCEGLKEIEKKQPDYVPANSKDERVCVSIEGVPNSICSPCGNGICDSEYEDYCNCPTDCD